MIPPLVFTKCTDYTHIYIYSYNRFATLKRQLSRVLLVQKQVRLALERPVSERRRQRQVVCSAARRLLKAVADYLETRTLTTRLDSRPLDLVRGNILRQSQKKKKKVEWGTGKIKIYVLYSNVD